MKEWKHEKAGTNTPPKNIPYLAPGATISKETPEITKLKEKREHLYALIGQTQIDILHRQQDIKSLYERICVIDYKIKMLSLCLDK